MSWYENMVNVIRHVIFKDTELKTLMKIPASDMNNIISFRDKYFIHGTITDTPITNEAVRILYSEEQPFETNAPNIFTHMLVFDIYVNDGVRWDASADRMQERGELIAQRLKQLLHNKRHFNIKFMARGVYDLTCKLEGYTRKTIVFTYKRIY